MKRLTVTGVTVHMTADDWDLYDSPGRNDAAIEINEAFQDGVAASMSPKELQSYVFKVMKKHEDLGATDSEPLYMLEWLIKELQGK